MEIHFCRRLFPQMALPRHWFDSGYGEDADDSEEVVSANQMQEFSSDEDADEENEPVDPADQMRQHLHLN